MTEPEDVKFDSRSIERLQTKLNAWIKIWRLTFACILTSILGYIAVLEDQPLLFIMALLPFPIYFIMQMYERKLEKALLKDTENDIRLQRLKRLQKKSAP